MNLRKFVLMEATPGAAGGSGGAAGADAGATGAGTAAGGAAAGAGTTTGDTGAASVLAKAGESAGSEAGKGAAAEEWTLPDKFKVTKDDGTLDMEASARKMGESLQHLEKRMGSGDAPPKTAEEYKVTVPDEWKEAFPADSETMATFRKDAHEQGLSQKQFDFFINKYIEQAPQLIKGGAAATQEAAEADLRTTWKTDAEFKTQAGHAFKAWQAFADPQDAGKMDEVGNSPAVVRLLARIGAEMKEGGSIPAAADGTGADDIKTLMMSEANTNPRHAEHKATRAKIDAYYNKKYGNAPVA